MQIPLRVITDYSLLKSLIKVPSLIDFLVKNNIKVCGICDENLSGSILFYDLCIEHGIKPLIGMSIKVSDLEVCLYAKNYDGYKDLIKLNTMMEVEYNDLVKYLDNVLIVLPMESINLYESLSKIGKVYLGYKTSFERINAYKYTCDVLWFGKIKTLKNENVEYLKYLDMLRKEEVVEHDECFDINFDSSNYEKFINEINLVIPKNKRYIPVYKNNSKEFLSLLRCSVTSCMTTSTPPCACKSAACSASSGASERVSSGCTGSPCAASHPAAWIHV